jgi:hypothetical protein
MRAIKSLGLALGAVFALAGATAGIASAGEAPVWFECKKAAVKNTGHHAEKNCSDAAKGTGGGYDLVEGVGKGKAFKAKGGESVLHSVNPEAKVDIPVTCLSGKGSGKAFTPGLVKGVVAIFSKCKALSAPCQNGKKETITTKTLSGTLGWINKPGKVVGTALVNEAEPGGPVAEFTCEALGEMRSRGSVIGQNSGNVGIISKTSQVHFVPGPYLGALEALCPKESEPEHKCKWTPTVNIPKFEGGPLTILRTEVKGSLTGHPTEFYPPGGIPSGQEGTSENKGEALGIYEEGTI